MRFLRPLAIAFSAYSRLPMPSMAWNERDSRWALACLPAVGCAEALLFAALGYASRGLSPLLRGALLFALPLLYTGGIHMDGFLDACDALSSLKSREERLAIMKDVHIGAFAVIRGMLYCVALFALYAETAHYPALAMGFMFSRSAVLALMTLMPNARKGGMLSMLQQGLAPRGALVSAGIGGLIAAGLAFCFAPAGAGCALALTLGFLALFRRKAIRLFGGITGDLAGFALQMAELMWAAGIVVGGNIA